MCYKEQTIRLKIYQAEARANLQVAARTEPCADKRISPVEQ